MNKKLIKKLDWLLIGGTVFWVVCIIISYGTGLAFLQNEFALIAEERCENHKNFVSAMSFFGPIGLVSQAGVALINGHVPFEHGIQFTCGVKERS